MNNYKKTIDGIEYTVRTDLRINPTTSILLDNFIEENLIPDGDTSGNYFFESHVAHDSYRSLPMDLSHEFREFNKARYNGYDAFAEAVMDEWVDHGDYDRAILDVLTPYGYEGCDIEQLAVDSAVNSPVENPYSSQQSEIAFQIWKVEQLQAFGSDSVAFEDWYQHWCQENGRFYITN